MIHKRGSEAFLSGYSWAYRGPRRAFVVEMAKI